MNEKNEIYGIARCSTSKQDVEYEITELVKKGVPKENIFIEYITGKADLDKRVELDKLFKIVKPGISKIVATDITRVARNPKTFYEILEFIENNNLCLEIGTLICDCRNSELDIMTSTMLQVLSVFASFDIKMKTFQIKLGLRNAKEKNVKLGRKAITKKTLENDPMFIKYYSQYKAKQINLSEMARLWGKCRNTCYNNIKIYECKNS